MRRLLVVVAVIVGLSCLSAGAALVPVPLLVQRAILKNRTSSLSYVRRAFPSGSATRTGATRACSRPALRLWFQRRGKPAAWQITFVATRQAGTCPRGEKSYQVDGNKVWRSHTANEQQAWRCVAGPGGSSRLTRRDRSSPCPLRRGTCAGGRCGPRIR